MDLSRVSRNQTVNGWHGQALEFYGFGFVEKKNIVIDSPFQWQKTEKESKTDITQLMEDKKVCPDWFPGALIRNLDPNSVCLILVINGELQG